MQTSRSRCGRPSGPVAVGELTARPPTLARIDNVSWKTLAPSGGARFRIEASDRASAGPILISPDIGTCDACVGELFDPQDRRIRYPFLNCTNRGPRFTIIRDSPYDRPHTTMASFPMCRACQAEYDDPRNRRFHAQPTACSACGPRLTAIDAAGRTRSIDDALAQAIDSLRRGKLVALKRIGGYHRACRADRDDAVAELRRRKHRDHKPLAVIVRDLPAATRLHGRGTVSTIATWP